MSNSLEQSVKDRLKNIANESGKDFNFISIQYMQERFLARLEKSQHRDNLILKGALLLIAYKVPTVRPSKDIDFKGEHTANDIDHIRLVIKEIAEIELDDGVTFLADRMEVQPITEDADYGGFRVKISGTVGGDRRRLQIDIGFGDTIIDGPVDMDYPVMLDFAAPNVKVYSIESSMAEKLEAIVSLGMFGSRMKDYFDVHFLIKNHRIDKKRLKRAINTTFSERNTPVGDFQYVFSNDFKGDKEKQQQWNAFLNRNFIESEKSFQKVIEEIDNYITSILE